MKADDKWGGLYRVTLDAQGQMAQWDQVPVPVGDAMGMLWAFDSLYVSGEGPEGRGIYRLQETPTATTRSTQWAMWKKVPGGNGEHGAHALVLGPDGKASTSSTATRTPLIDGIDARFAVPELRRGRSAAARHGPGGHLLRQDQEPLRLRPAHRRGRHEVGAHRRRLPQSLRHRLQRRRRALHLRQRHGVGRGPAVVSPHARAPRGARRRIWLPRRHGEMARVLSRLAARRQWISASAARRA